MLIPVRIPDMEIPIRIPGTEPIVETIMVMTDLITTTGTMAIRIHTTIITPGIAMLIAIEVTRIAMRMSISGQMIPIVEGKV